MSGIKRNHRLTKLTFIIIILLLNTYSLSAQPDNPPPVPIDTNIIYLLIAGFLYGIRNLVKSPIYNNIKNIVKGK